MKVLITEATLVPTGETAPRHVEANEEADVHEDVARKLVASGRALYVNDKDDPTRTKHQTASAERRAAAASARKGGPRKAAAQSAAQPE